MHLLRFYISFFFRWLKFFFKAQTKHDVHSPFVSEFITEVVENERTYYTFLIVETLRKKLLRNKSKVKITDHGAGSMVNKKSQRSIQNLIKYAAISPQLGRTLFNIVRIHKPKTILELGTSLGISTLYQAGAAPKAKFITIEGCPEIAQVAQNNLNSLGMHTIEVQSGTFAAKLPKALQTLKKLDYLYIDGDHRSENTLKYFDSCLPFAHKDSLFIIADIHWSKDMEAAWAQLKQHDEVSVSIDLFHFGLLFFRKTTQYKSDYSIVKYRYKPWRMGFFG